MGVDCRIQLPMDIPMEDVGDVIAALAGVHSEVDSFSGGGDTVHRARSFDRDGLKYFPADHAPGMFDIVLKNVDGLVDGEQEHSVFFHHCCNDCSNGKSYNLLSPPSTPFWCAVGKRLVKFFGGTVVFCDTGLEKGDNIFRRKRSCPVNRWGQIPDNGKLWQDYHDAIINMPKITEKELLEALESCAYKANFDKTTGRRI